MLSSRKPPLTLILLLGTGLALVYAAPSLGAPAAPALNVPYVTTPPHVVQAMVRMARVGQSDVVYDLGCGDGRMVIEAVRATGARGVGVDIDPARIRESEARARVVGVSSRVRFVQGDLFQTDVRPATVVMLYLLPRINLALRAKFLRDLRPGARIVSHTYDMDDWTPDFSEVIQSERGPRPIFGWIVPAPIDGRWTGKLVGEGDSGRPIHLLITQRFQRFEGVLRLDGREHALLEGRVEGGNLRFRVQGMQGLFKLRAQGEKLEGAVEGAPAGQISVTREARP